MTRQEFIELTGEDPVDVFGGDWQNEVAELEREDRTSRKAYENSQLSAND